MRSISRPGFDRDQNGKRQFCDDAQLADEYGEMHNVPFENGHRSAFGSATWDVR